MLSQPLDIAPPGEPSPDSHSVTTGGQLGRGGCDSPVASLLPTGGVLLALDLQRDVDELVFLTTDQLALAGPVQQLVDAEIVPIISPLGRGQDGQAYNINADIAAAKIAQALRAHKIIYLSDVNGVRRDPRDDGPRITGRVGADQGRRTQCFQAEHAVHPVRHG